MAAATSGCRSCSDDGAPFESDGGRCELVLTYADRMSNTWSRSWAAHHSSGGGSAAHGGDRVPVRAHHGARHLRLQPQLPDADLLLLFTFTAFSGQLGEFDTLPENWIIQWERFIGAGGGRNKARRFDTKLSGGLFHLQTIEGVEDDEQGTNSDRANLAIRTLLRGYALRMPTGRRSPSG